MLVTSDPDWGEGMAWLGTEGMERRYHDKGLGWKARLDALQAAILRVKLPHLDRWSEARQAAARRYDALIEEQHLGHFLQRPTVRPNRRHVFNQYVVRVAGGQRDALVNYLKAENIGCEIYYPIPLPPQESLVYLAYRSPDFPATHEPSPPSRPLPT